MLDDARTTPARCACDELFELCHQWILWNKRIGKLEVELKKSVRRVSHI